MAGNSKVTSADRPRKYIYDLPTIFHECNAEDHEHRIYAAEHLLPTQLAASAFVTKDPKEADLFYVPAYIYCLQSEFRLAIGEPSQHVHRPQYISGRVLASKCSASSPFISTLNSISKSKCRRNNLLINIMVLVPYLYTAVIRPWKSSKPLVRSSYGRKVTARSASMQNLKS